VCRTVESPLLFGDFRRRGGRRLSIIDGRSLEQNDHRDQQAEQAGGFAQRETEQHVGVLALGAPGMRSAPDR